MKNTGAMCVVAVNDNNQKYGIKYIDIGNYFIADNGKKCVITTKKLASKYHKLIDCDIYTIKNEGGAVKLT